MQDDSYATMAIMQTDITKDAKINYIGLYISDNLKGWDMVGRNFFLQSWD